jgi:hypothetical protein
VIMAARFAVLLALFTFFGVSEVKADDVPFLVTRLDVYLYDEGGRTWGQAVTRTG